LSKFASLINMFFGKVHLIHRLPAVAFVIFSVVYSKAQSPLVVNAVNNVTVCKGSSVSIGGNPTASGGGGSYQYSWSPFAGLDNPGAANPNANPVSTTKYSLTVTDNLNNSAKDSVTVYVDSLLSLEQCSPLIFYNTFTPNKDGVNDTWVIVNAVNYLNNTLEVYNRYGQLVYWSNPYLNTWDGTAMGNDLAAATYYYVFDPGDGSKKYNGTVTILR